jgi:hypothetical protein
LLGNLFYSTLVNLNTNNQQPSIAPTHYLEGRSRSGLLLHQMEDPKPDKQCAHCGNIGEFTKCGRCKDTYYCGSECQKAAWLVHKHLCAEDPVEKAVLRAGWLLKKLFLASRERAGCEWMYAWEWNPKHTHLSIKRLKRPGHFVKFTSAVTVTEEEREMILAARYCKAAVGFFSDLLKMLLQGESPIQKHFSTNSNANKKIARVQDQGVPEWLDGYEVHHIFLVSPAKDKAKSWFIDLTGAQFGIPTPVHKVYMYMKKWGKSVHTIAPQGIAKAQLIELGIGEGAKEVYLGIMFRQDAGVASAVEAAVQNWKKQTGFTSSELRSTGSNSRYEELEPLVIKAIDEYVAGYDRAGELAKVPPLDNYDEGTIDVEAINAENKRIYQKQAQDMRKYRFQGSWA